MEDDDAMEGVEEIPNFDFHPDSHELEENDFEEEHFANANDGDDPFDFQQIQGDDQFFEELDDGNMVSDDILLICTTPFNSSQIFFWNE